MNDYNRSCHFCFSGIPLDQHERIQADARALWSVRVLDKAEPIGWHFEWHGKRLTALTPGARYRFFDESSRETTRIAAAQAVYPTLPADVRAKLGVPL